MFKSKLIFGLSTKLVRPLPGRHLKAIRMSSSGQDKAKAPASKGPGSNENPISDASFNKSYNSNNKKPPLPWIAAGLALIAGTAFYAYKKNIFDTDSGPDMMNQHEKSKKKEKVQKVISKVDIPTHIPYLLIGAGTASFAAFRAIKSNDPKAKVLVIGEEEFNPYMRPPLSKELWFNNDPETTKNLRFTQWNGKERSIFFEHEDFYCSPMELNERENGGVAVVRGHKVIKVEPHTRTATLDSQQTITYDKCLIATGGQPKNLEVFEKADEHVQDRVVLFRNIDDFCKLEKVINNANSITIVGGGFLGSELACALGRKAHSRKLVINQIFPENGNMGKVLPEYLSRWTTEKVKTEGVNVTGQVNIKSAESKGRQVVLKLSNDEELVTDYVIVAVGLEPRTDIAAESGLEIDPKLKGYLVNAELEARSNLYVAGDAACFFDVHLGRRRVEHHDHAVVSGRLAGENMAGGNKHYVHQSMFWSDLGPEVGYEAIGIVDSELPTVGIFAKATEKDTPKAVVEASGEGVRSEMEQSAVPPKPSEETPSTQPEGEQYGKGVIFYLRDDIIVGIVMWNVFNRMPIARKVIKERYHRKNISEVSKLFNLYSTDAE